jgi:diaminopimelate decarboxylase
VTTHEAGWAHAAGALDGPSWLRAPTTSTRCTRCSGAVRRAHRRRGVEVGGVDLRDLLAEHNSPAYVLDEADFRHGPGVPRRVQDYDVFYAGKAFLCTTVAVGPGGGAHLDVCSPAS